MVTTIGAEVGKTHRKKAILLSVLPDFFFGDRCWLRSFVFGHYPRTVILGGDDWRLDFGHETHRRCAVAEADSESDVIILCLIE